MHIKQNRIFISDLPITASEPELKAVFNKYGEITSIEIKERKNNIKNQSPFYAYINLNCDNYSLQQCFEYFNNNQWLGENVQLQIAKESFLERLKREREENTKKEKAEEPIQDKPQILTVKKPFKRKIETSEDSSETSSDETNKTKPIKKKRNDVEVKVEQTKQENGLFVKNDLSIDDKEKEELYSEIKVKNNKNKLNSGKLQIEGFGKEPIVKIEPKKPKSLDKYRSQANEKRLQSMSQMRDNYNRQKLLLKSALSKVDKTDKIPNGNKPNNDEKTLTLFNDNESDNEDYNFDIKDTFQGKQGEKLLKLQSKYGNDKRFQLNENFVEDEIEEQEMETENDLQQEKNKEYEILEEILGSSVKRKNAQNKEVKMMRRFDPSQPDHAKYELKKEKHKKEELKESNETIEPEVSKEVFYEVKENLKDKFDGGNATFSLLNMFGSQNVDKTNDESEPKILKPSKYIPGENPFKYDSSDDEARDKETKTQEPKKLNKNMKTWTEPLFFQEDDYRFQEGFEFVQKITSEIEGDFSEVRRSIKVMVKNKMRSNQRKNRMFKKKLGGRRRDKMKKIEKAIKR